MRGASRDGWSPSPGRVRTQSRSGQQGVVDIGLEVYIGGHVDHQPPAVLQTDRCRLARVEGPQVVDVVTPLPFCLSPVELGEIPGDSDEGVVLLHPLAALEELVDELRRLDDGRPGPLVGELGGSVPLKSLGHLPDGDDLFEPLHDLLTTGHGSTTHLATLFWTSSRHPSHEC